MTTVVFTHTRTRAGELHTVCLHTHTRTGKLHGLLTKVTQLDDAPVCSVYDWLPLLSVNFPLILTPNVTRVYGTNNCHNKNLGVTFYCQNMKQFEILFALLFEILFALNVY